MNLLLLQTDLVWEDKAANLRHINQLLTPYIADTIDVVVLPEMFTTGFSMNAAALAENLTDSNTLRQMKKWAAQLNALIIGSIIVAEKEHYYNRLIAVQPTGCYDTYDKRHLFAMANEHHFYTAGTQKLLIEWRGWRIRPLICYDLRFPTWSRNGSDGHEPYDLLLYIANWPARRALHWETLLRARAIENQAYTVGVNRIGYDANELWYSGDSVVIDPAGEYVFEAKSEPVVQCITLDLQHLKAVRMRLPFLEDRD